MSIETLKRLKFEAKTEATLTVIASVVMLAIPETFTFGVVIGVASVVLWLNYFRLKNRLKDAEK